MGLAFNLYKKLANDSLHLKNNHSDVKNWETFLSKLPVPHNSIERAYNKYQCRQYFFSREKNIILNLAGFLFLLLEIPCLFFSNHSRETEKANLLVVEKNNEVKYDDVIPHELLNRYSQIQVIENINKRFGIVSRESRKVILQCIKLHPMSFFFQYFVYKELLAHDGIIRKYKPQEVAVYVNERNVASPILKEIYESQGREFTSFMHGEYLLNMIQAYMSFSNYYIWDNSYISSFRDFLKCDIDHYLVYTPDKLKKKWNVETHTPSYQYTYYFSNEKKKQIKIVADVLTQLQKQNINCKVRPHPRFMENIEEMRESFQGVLIENPREVPMEQSISDTMYAVGLVTTVLFEAETEGRKIVIDDVSDREMFDSLAERRYRLLSHEHKLLSDIIKENNITV